MAHRRTTATAFPNGLIWLKIPDLHVIKGSVTQISNSTGLAGPDPNIAARNREFGNPEAAQIIAAIQNPETSTQLRSIFEKFDKDHSGGLDLQEWRAFGRYLFQNL